MNFVFYNVIFGIITPLPETFLRAPIVDVEKKKHVGYVKPLEGDV